MRRIHVSLPDDLADWVDEQRGDVDRSVWIRRHLEALRQVDAAIPPGMGITTMGRARGAGVVRRPDLSRKKIEPRPKGKK